jgi:geranylgeranyl pyrophosphate synthase
MLAARTGDVRVVGVFASTLGQLCDGQHHELFDSHKLDQQADTYIRRIYGKTASLFAGAAEMGSVLAHAPEDHVQELRQFATEIGLAFQIQDDVLDITRGSAELGKPAGNDLRQGTVTLPTLLFAQRIEPGSADAQLLDHVVSDDNAGEIDVARLVDRIRESGADESAMETARTYRTRAIDRLGVVPDPTTRDLLTDWVDQALAIS